MPTRDGQEAVARALAEVVGKPFATLDTENVHRFLFGDGTSVDWLPKTPVFKPMYNLVALKTIVCYFCSPAKQAAKFERTLVSRGHRVQIVKQPDPASPIGSVVLILSESEGRFPSSVRHSRF